jgi:hypothetical protein
MEHVSRRSFIARGSVGVAGAAAAAAGGVGIAAMAAPAGAAPLTDDEIRDLNQPVLLQVRDAASGEVELLVGETEVVFTDRSLVAKVLRATR